MYICAAISIHVGTLRPFPPQQKLNKYVDKNIIDIDLLYSIYSFYLDKKVMAKAICKKKEQHELE